MKEYDIIVLMATYNGEKYIRQQIDSVLSQEGVDLKLIVRDDGSIDNTQKILDEYKHMEKLEWYTGSHLNVAKGFLDILNNAPYAKYYAFCDQDDVWKPKKLISAIQILEKEDNNIPLLYYGSTTLVDENLKYISDHLIKKHRSDLARFIFNDMSGNTMVFNNQLRKLLIESKDVDIKIHDKWALQLCLACGGKCIGDENSYILYRQHGKNTIGMELTVLDKIKKFFNVVRLPKDTHMELLTEYQKEIKEPYLSLVRKCENGKKMLLKNRITVAFDKNIKFGDTFYQIAFIIHVLKGNL